MNENEIHRRIQYEAALDEANIEDGPDAAGLLNILHGLGMATCAICGNPLTHKAMEIKSEICFKCHKHEREYER